MLIPRIGTKGDFFGMIIVNKIIKGKRIASTTAQHGNEIEVGELG